MTLINDIINLLSSDKSSLGDALLKTKVLLYKIGHKELADWVDWEIEGYPDAAQIPDYRILQGEIRGTIVTFGGRYPSHALPVRHLSDEERDRLLFANATWGVSVIENMLGGRKNNNAFKMPFPLEANRYLGKTLAEGYIVEKAWLQIEAPKLYEILTKVRARLLDFALKLQDELGEDTTDEQMKNKASTIDATSLFTNSVFGGDVTVIVGSHNLQQITNAATTGDFLRLEAALKKYKVPDEDISSLKEAIDSDKGTEEVANKKLGPSVKAWMHNMMGKAINTSWQIELAVAGNLLTSALQAYYG
ncbi:hypothetical protein [Undibacterium sp.]|uniref:AbiTii domain-containing protein n=1 Tax=Undibacterium sp. TaxID=1914977 RepID=UPI002C136B8B|nr:hypothetical protein [Undibacterium sp.]HTD05101.1 hypothetical protein [Undibacterium sp.]